MRGRLAILAVSVAAMAAFAGSAQGDAPWQTCTGHARLRHSGYVNFSFECGSFFPTSFRVRANHRIVKVDDPSGVYKCSRESVRAWDCEARPGPAPDHAHARLRVAGAVCDPRLELRVKPRNGSRWGNPFTLDGPC